MSLSLFGETTYREVLVACSADKAPVRSRVRHLYTSPLFQKSLAWGSTVAPQVQVLSALHGLVDLDDELEPYDWSMDRNTPQRREDWALRVAARLRHLRKGDTVALLAGRSYTDPLRPVLRERGLIVDEPLSGLMVGQRLHWLNERLQACKEKT